QGHGDNECRKSKSEKEANEVVNVAGGAKESKQSTVPELKEWGGNRKGKEWQTVKGKGKAKNKEKQNMEGHKTNKGDGNLFNTLRGEHSGKGVLGVKKNCNMQQQEEVIVIEETLNVQKEGGETTIGEVEQGVTNEESPNVLRKGEAANEVRDSTFPDNFVNQELNQGENLEGTALSLEEEVNINTQEPDGRDQDSSENKELFCALNKKCSSMGDSFLVDHNYSPVWGVMTVVDEGRGLIQRTEPPDKGYWSDKGSSLSVNNAQHTLGEDDDDSVEPDVNSLEVYSQEVENENNMGAMNLSSSQ
ncbi:unnamed protein product, partial [Ilex paraguariensis]